MTELVTRLFGARRRAGAAYAGYVPQAATGSLSRIRLYGQPQPQQYRPQQQMPPQEQPYDNGYAAPEDYGYNEGYTDDYAYDDYGGEEQYEDDAPQKAGAVDRLKAPHYCGNPCSSWRFLICLFVFGGNLFGGEEPSSGAKVTATTVSVVSGETTTEATAAATGDSVMPDLAGQELRCPEGTLRLLDHCPIGRGLQRCLRQGADLLAGVWSGDTFGFLRR